MEKKYMSWNLGNPEIKREPAETAKALLAQNVGLPPQIRDYVTAGIDGLVAKFGPETHVTVSGHGHLTDKDTYEVTSATIDVRREA
jgi:hypothetical protein